MDNIHILLLAAGESIRMGTPKQLLDWGEDVLIQHQCKTLLQLKNPLDVVLGAHSEKIKEYIQTLPIEIIIHNEWNKGMGSSISFGVKTIFERGKACEGILISLVDQPLINESHYRKLLKAFKPGEKQIIVSCDVSGYWSAPALMDKFYFQELMELEGESGAKKVIMNHQERVHLVNCETSLEDIDTPESYTKMLEKANLLF